PRRYARRVERRSGRVKVLSEIALRRLRLERKFAREHLEEDDSERVEIAAPVHALAGSERAGLLRRAVLELAAEHARPGHLQRLAEGIGLRDLDDADLVEVDVPGLVDLAHPAFARFFEDFVLSVEHLPGRKPGPRRAARGAESRVRGHIGAAARTGDWIGRHFLQF